MKNKMKLTTGIAGIILLISFNSMAQVDVANHSWSSGYYVGWNSAQNLDFKISSSLYLTLTSNGDLNLNDASRAFQIGGNNVFRVRNSNTTIFLGVGAGNTGAAAENTFCGYNAGANTTGSFTAFNTFFGSYAGFGNGTAGEGNTAIGCSTLVATSNSGDYNTFVGFLAGTNNTASGNTFMGQSSGNANTSGSGNAYFGYLSGVLNVVGSNNTLIGVAAGNGGNAGDSFSNNTYLGSNAGQYRKTGRGNLLLQHPYR